MKKTLSFLLALVMVLSLAACGGNHDAEQTEAPTEPPVEVPGSALEILENTWNLFDDSEKFPVMGGDAVNMVDGAPGEYGLADTASLEVQLLVPADQVANIDEAASLFHGMMLNNFTSGVFHVTGDAQAFANMLAEKMQNNQWMCGFPEKGMVAIIGGEYVAMAFGLNDAVNPFTAKLTQAYPEAELLFNDAIV